MKLRAECRGELLDDLGTRERREHRRDHRPDVGALALLEPDDRSQCVAPQWRRGDRRLQYLNRLLGLVGRQAPAVEIAHGAAVHRAGLQETTHDHLGLLLPEVRLPNPCGRTGAERTRAHHGRLGVLASSYW